MNTELEIKETNKYGKGVFADRNIKKGERLAIFGGYIMSLEEEKQLPKNIRDLAHQIDDNFVIGIKEENEIQNVDNFNHSCDPNAGFKGQIFLVAMRDIEAGEEITFDYAMTLGGDEPYSMECLCGKENCRKIITNEDWKNPELQEKYKGYFLWYLEEKINKLQD